MTHLVLQRQEKVLHLCNEEHQRQAGYPNLDPQSSAVIVSLTFGVATAIQIPEFRRLCIVVYVTVGGSLFFFDIGKNHVSDVT